MMVFFTILACLAALSPCQASFFSFPLHASCKVTWTVPTTCADFESRIVAQMKAWEGESNCGQVSSSCPDLPCGQKCLYQYTGTSGNVVSGTHTTPVHKYVDDLTFTMSESGQSCTVEGFSTSETWYAVLDFGTNYCNMRNLADGAGFSAEDGFQESTADGQCTQFSSANCERY